MSKRWIKVGSVDQTIDVFIADSSSTTGAGLAALVFNSAGLLCYYRKGATGSATALALATLATIGTAHADGGFKEVDATNMKGVYRLDLSDTIVAAAGMVTLYLFGATNMAPVVIEIECVAVDIYDTVRLGLTSLPNAAAEASGGLYTRGTGAGQINQPANGSIDANAVALSGDTVAADNAEAFFDGTGYAGTGNVIPTVTTVTNVTTVNGLAANVITATSIATDAITAAKIAADAIGSSELAATAVTEIAAGVFAQDMTGIFALSSFGEAAQNYTLTDSALLTRIGVPSNLGGGATLSFNLSDIEAQTDDIGTAGAGLTALPWNAAWDAEVQSEVQDAIEVNHLDHLLAADYDPASKPGVATALLNELIESDAGVSRYTANALEQAPSGGGGGGGSVIE